MCSDWGVAAAPCTPRESRAGAQLPASAGLLDAKHSRPARLQRRDASANRAPRAQGMPTSRSEEHTSELQSLMRISYAVFCLNTKKVRNTAIATLSHDQL